MKNIITFENFVNEAFSVDPKDEKVLGKQKFKSAGTNRPDWEMNVVEFVEDEDTWIIVTGELAKKITDSDTIWIPKDQWEEFKKTINSI